MCAGGGQSPLYNMSNQLLSPSPRVKSTVCWVSDFAAAVSAAWALHFSWRPCAVARVGIHQRCGTGDAANMVPVIQSQREKRLRLE